MPPRLPPTYRRFGPGYPTPIAVFTDATTSDHRHYRAKARAGPRAPAANGARFSASSRWWANYRRRWRGRRLTASTGEIESWLGKICQALDLDRSAVYERDAPGEPVRTTHTWRRANFPPFPRNYDPGKLIQKTTNWVMAGNQLTFSRPSNIPAELEDARRFVERYGPKASAVIPMWAGGKVIGAASFGKFRSSSGMAA